MVRMPEPEFERSEAVSRPVAAVETKAAEPNNFANQQVVDLLRQEIDGLKDLLKEQTEQLKAPVEHAPITPQYERLESRLQTLGFSAGFVRKILLHYDREDSIDTNWRKVMNRFSSALPTPLYEPLSSGGVYALTGPTGAGKTTTIAKLAAHAVKDFGLDSVAIVSLDWFQVGGQEILRSVSEILDVEFHALSEKDSLAETLKGLKHKRLVLIDTSGSSEAMAHWNQILQQPSLTNLIQPVLVLPATMTPAAVSQFVQQHVSKAFSGVVLSKVDESACFGGLLEPVMKHRWPLWYCTNGQNIPQDIELADARAITKRLVGSLRTQKADLAKTSLAG
jgi:flagellar biosynthesis protein FlhF